MRSSSYSRANFGLDARKPLTTHRSTGKSCGYYLRIVFFFSSLIQSLIIASLVLFLVYGQPEKSAEELRVKELEQSFNQLSVNNVKLRKEKGELGAQLAARGAEKAAVEKEVEKLKAAANDTAKAHQVTKLKLTLCEDMKRQMMLRCTAQALCPSAPETGHFASQSEVRILQSLNTQQKAMIGLIEANFTRMVQYLSQDRDNAIRDRDAHNQDAIVARQENIIMKEQLATYTRKCKEDFAKSLEGIQTVTSGFLVRINNLFPHHLIFHLTCEKQQQQMEKFRTSCTNLSREVEDRFQKYLNNVGDQVAKIQGHSSHLEVQNDHLTSDIKACKESRAAIEAKSIQEIKAAQRTHDGRMKIILEEQRRTREDKILLTRRVELMETEAQTLKRTTQNCKPTPVQPGQVTRQMPGTG